MKARTALLVALMLAFSLALTAAAQTPAQQLSNTRADPAAAITSANVQQLGLAWKVPTDEPVTHTPLIDNGRVYFADWGGTVYAADATTGKVIWKNTVQQPMAMWPWHGFAGTGVLANGLLVEASVEGMAYGIDPANGTVKWQTRFADQNQQAGSISTLLNYNGLVYIGLSSVQEPLSEMMPDLKLNFQGKVVALDAATGKQAWQLDLAKAPQNGVAMWSSFALDPGMNALFFGTGNNYSGEASDLSDALLAVNAQTGAIIWETQVTDHDVWVKAMPKGPDYDFGAGPQLFEATIDGQTRQLVGAGQKSGVYWVFDRQTGKPVWHTTVGYGSVGGGMRGEASVANGRVYVWSNNNYEDKNPTEHPVTVKALDAATGKNLWVNDKAQPAIGTAAGFLANDVYFVGSLDGTVHAYRATDGQPVWTSPTQGSIGSSLWAVGDSLYFGAGVPMKFGGGPATNGLYAYRLGASAAPTPSASPSPAPSASPSPMPSPAPSMPGLPNTGGGGMAGSSALPLGAVVAGLAGLLAVGGYGLVRRQRRG